MTETNLDVPTTGQIAAANKRRGTPVADIHLLWLVSNSWDRWAAALIEDIGFAAVTPGWPDDPTRWPRPRSILRSSPTGRSARSAGHFAEVLGELETRPAVSGHSFGGYSHRSWLAEDCPPSRSRSTRHRSEGVVVAGQRTPVGVTGGQPREPAPGGATVLRAVPLRLRERGLPGRACELCGTFALPAPGAPLFQAAAAGLNAWTEVKVRI